MDEPTFPDFVKSALDEGKPLEDDERRMMITVVMKEMIRRFTREGVMRKEFRCFSYTLCHKYPGSLAIFSGGQMISNGVEELISDLT